VNRRHRANTITNSSTWYRARDWLDCRSLVVAGTSEFRLLRGNHPQNEVKYEADATEAREQDENHAHESRIPSISDCNALAYAGNHAPRARKHEPPLRGRRRRGLRTHGVSVVRTMLRISGDWLATIVAVQRQSLSHHDTPLSICSRAALHAGGKDRCFAGTAGYWSWLFRGSCSPLPRMRLPHRRRSRSQTPSESPL
jgi:hypothetical protein